MPLFGAVARGIGKVGRAVMGAGRAMVRGVRSVTPAGRRSAKLQQRHGDVAQRFSQAAQRYSELANAFAKHKVPGGLRYQRRAALIHFKAMGIAQRAGNAGLYRQHQQAMQTHLAGYAKGRRALLRQRQSAGGQAPNAPSTPSPAKRGGRPAPPRQAGAGRPAQRRPQSGRHPLGGLTGSVGMVVKQSRPAKRSRSSKPGRSSRPAKPLPAGKRARLLRGIKRGIKSRRRP